MSDLIRIANRFSLDGPAVSAENYGSGHINDTYKLTTDSGRNYIMQKINDKVFRNVPQLMENIERVTEYVCARLEGTEDEKTALRLIRARSGESFVEYDEGFYRVYNFISPGVSIESKPTQREFELSAIGFGRFQKLLDGFPANKLNITIPDFHNTRSRFADFQRAVSADVSDRLRFVREEADFFFDRQIYCGRIVDLLDSGEMPLRVTHNDTKLNNVLIDIKADRAVAVIDLDTVMPGSVAYDFGDSIRFGASTAAEDEQNLNKVAFSTELFEAYTRGFISVCDTLTACEIENLAFGAVLMTYECGMRFLTDYLNGDVYFKTHRPGHNLDRARTQMKLVEDMEKAMPKMQMIVQKYAKNK